MCKYELHNSCAHLYTEHWTRELAILMRQNVCLCGVIRVRTLVSIIPTYLLRHTSHGQLILSHSLARIDYHAWSDTGQECCLRYSRFYRATYI